MSLAAIGPTGAYAISLEEAIRTAVATNPRIGQAAANSRATEFELRQAQGGLLPQVRASASAGWERFEQARLPAGARDNKLRDGGEGGLTVRQLLWDGFATTNEIYRNMYRVEASNWRTYERSELVALDTAQAYIDVIRVSESLAYAQRNLEAHRRLANNVQARFSGGRAGEGDAQQVRERLKGAEATVAEFKIRLEEAKASYRKTVGIEPAKLSAPTRLGGLPSNKQAALNEALRGNPTIQAAKSDVDATRAQLDGSKGAFGPSVFLEGKSNWGSDTNRTTGRFNEQSAKVTASWDLYRGGSDLARNRELQERVNEASMQMSVLQRAAFESIDTAWGARANIGARISALSEEVRAAERVVAAYSKEYELGQRTLLDLLNAENSVLNAKVSLAAARGVSVFSDYQLMAAMGKLLAHLRIDKPAEARPVSPSSRSLFPNIANDLNWGAKPQ